MGSTPGAARARRGTDQEGCTLFEAPYVDEEMLLSWVVGLGGCGELLDHPS